MEKTKRRQPIRIGIVTPTFQRMNMLEQFVAQLEKQTYAHWVAAIVHDGPSESFQDFSKQLSDPRILVGALESRSSDAGASVRKECLRLLAKKGVDYIVFWDDDNLFFTHALSAIAKDLRHFRLPDLLLAPIYWNRGQSPQSNLTDLAMRGVDSANMVLKTKLAIQACNFVVQEGLIREQDYQAFEFVRRLGCRMVLGRTVIGDYDGLRTLPKLMRSLHLPESVIYWGQVIRVQRSLQHLVRQSYKKGYLKLKGLLRLSNPLKE